MGFESFLSDYERAQKELSTFVVVTVVNSRGSIPQEVGARLIVSSAGYFAGTVGGGKLEKAAIEKSRSYLQEGASGSFFHDWNLQSDLKMSCGGTVGLFFEVHDREKNWNVVVFGAGHVSQELVRVLLRLECRLTCIDSRTEWLEKLPKDRKLQTKCLDPMQDYVAEISARDFVVIATMGHATDLPILGEILRYKNPRYVGVIGSDVKAKRLRQDLFQMDFSKEKMDSFFCPIGENIGNNTPAEMAISITSQLLRLREEIPSREVHL